MTEVAHIGSLEWAGALGQRSGMLTRAEIAEAYDSAEGRRHRIVLKESSPGILAQLVDVIRDRLAGLDAQNGISSST